MRGKIVPIVEGDGEVAAVPTLLHKLLTQRGISNLSIAQPKNAHGSGNLTKQSGVERFVQYAWTEPDCVAVLVIIDGDCFRCVVELARQLAARIRALNVVKPTSIVVAYREYEAWFLASLPSIAGKRIGESVLLPQGLVLKEQPETIRDVKGWLSRRMSSGMAYKETEHQLLMTRLLDLKLASDSSRSFRRLCSAMDQILMSIGESAIAVTP